MCLFGKKLIVLLEYCIQIKQSFFLSVSVQISIRLTKNKLQNFSEILEFSEKFKIFRRRKKGGRPARRRILEGPLDFLFLYFHRWVTLFIATFHRVTLFIANFHQVTLFIATFHQVTLFIATLSCSPVN